MDKFIHVIIIMRCIKIWPNERNEKMKRKNIPFSVELNGLLIILMAIIGIGGIERFGPMGNLIESFLCF